MQIFLKTLLLSVLALQNSFGASSFSQSHKLSGAETSLISSIYEQNGEKKLVAGVEFKLKEGWKIYGNDDSGMGMPPEFNFSASQNYKNHNIINKLLYRSNYRGCKETDFLIGNFAKEMLIKMSAVELLNFDLFLNEEDVEIYDWVLGKSASPKHYSELIEKISSFYNLNK